MKKTVPSEDVILKKPFISLPHISLPTYIDDFVLNTEFYEKEIAMRNGGLSLSSVHQCQLTPEEEKHYEKIIPYHAGNHSKMLLRNIIQKAKKINHPISKIVDNKDALEEDMLRIYQVAYAHYVITKNDPTPRMKNFPKNCCGPSSSVVTFSLMLHGYLNAAYAMSESANHAYVILPFVMQSPHFQGVVLVDPTSDQLGPYYGTDTGKDYRNLMALKTGVKWKYVTEYRKKKDLFPNRIVYIKNLAEPETLTRNGELDSDNVEYFHDGILFLKQAFSHPTRLEIAK